MRSATSVLTRRKTIRAAAAVVCLGTCAHLSSLPLNGRWYVPGMGEVDVRFGMMTISNPSAKAFVDSGNAITMIPVIAWSWNGIVHVIPNGYAYQTGSLGGPGGRAAPLLPVRHNMRPGSIRTIDRCTLSAYGHPMTGRWQRIERSCPKPEHPMMTIPSDVEFHVDDPAVE